MRELIDPRSDSVRVFLRRWYGATAAGRPAIALESDQIPRKLVDWHDAVASIGVAVTFHNHPVEPSKLARSDDGMMIFWMENQGSYYWAVDPDDEQPAVFVTGYPTEDPWQATGETPGGFLLHCTVDEAMLGAAVRFVVMVPGRVAQSKAGCCGAGRPDRGRMHDVTALRTEGIEDLLRQYPNVRAMVDSGYQGLARDFPDQVTAPPKEPPKDATEAQLAEYNGNGKMVA